MSIFDLATLTQFTGTERYYRISRKHLLTDGTKLSNSAQYFPLISAQYFPLFRVSDGYFYDA